MRPIDLKDALKTVDEWLNSDDTWVTDEDGNKIEGGLIACKPGTMMGKFIEKMNNKPSKFIEVKPTMGSDDD